MAEVYFYERWRNSGTWSKYKTTGRWYIKDGKLYIGIRTRQLLLFPEEQFISEEFLQVESPFPDIQSCNN